MTPIPSKNVRRGDCVKNVKWILMWIRGSRWKLVASVVLSLLGIVFMTAESYIFADVVDDILMPQAFDKLPLYLAAAFAVLLIRLACNYFQNILAEQAGQTGVYNLRSACLASCCGRRRTSMPKTAPAT